MLKAAPRAHNLKHFVHPSSLSVCGGNDKRPLSIDDPENAPNSLYAATKRADKLIGYA